MAITYANSIILRDVVFRNNFIVNSVDCSNVKWWGGSLYYAFDNCRNLTAVYNFHPNITNMEGTFKNCQNLVIFPNIPNNVTSIKDAFYNCKSINTIPTIPESVTNIDSAFSGCSNITTIPTIPNVTSLNYTFAGTNITTVPVIPESVTSLNSTFANCTALTGSIYINSTNVSSAINCFGGTTSIKHVYIPFSNRNNGYTQTYNSFITAGYDTIGTKEGVYLVDSCEYKLNVDGFTYTSDSSNNITLETYTGTNTTVVIPNLEDL